MNPENADSDVEEEEEEETTAPAPTKAAKPAATKQTDVASAFDDLFNS